MQKKKTKRLQFWRRLTNSYGKKKMEWVGAVFMAVLIKINGILTDFYFIKKIRASFYNRLLEDSASPEALVWDKFAFRGTEFLRFTRTRKKELPQCNILKSPVFIGNAQVQYID